MAMDGQGASPSSTGPLTAYDEQEWAFRQQRFEQLRGSADDGAGVLAVNTKARAAGRDALTPIIDRFRADHDAARFRQEMDKLFERFVADELQRAIPDLRVLEQGSVNLGHSGAVPMKPDICLDDRHRVVAVADCKYKVLDDPYARAPDYDQVLAYATAPGLDEARLLYVRGLGDPHLEEVSVRNTQITLRTASSG